MFHKLRLAGKVVLYWILATISCVVLYLYGGFPAWWNSIEHGMTREQLHAIGGQPRTCCSWDVKGDFYVQSNPLGEWEFLASPSGDNVVAYTRVWLFLGPNKAFRVIVKENGSYLNALRHELF